MIRRLRFKLIATSMLILLAVLASIVTALNLFNYKRIVRDSDNILNYIADNGGIMPKDNYSIAESDLSNVKSSYISTDKLVLTAIDSYFSTPIKTPTSASEPAHKDNPETFLDIFYSSPLKREYKNESRYVSILLDANGHTASAIDYRISYLRPKEACSLAEDIFTKGKKSGFIDSYRYLIRKNKDGTSLVILLDCYKSIRAMNTILLASCLISSGGFLLVLLLVILLSKRIIKPIAESYEKQKEFITNAGHEIKTPITIINADSDVLELDMGTNEWLDDIKVQTNRLSKLTDDLIFLSKMEEKNPKAEFIDFPLSDVAHDLVKSFNSIAKTENKILNIEIDDNITMKGNETAISRLISVLIDNALKYSPSNTDINFALKKQKNSIVISVENYSNESLDANELLHFFDRFYRANKSRNSKTKGYGIGLSIAYVVVENHKGKIKASTENGNKLLIKASFPLSN